MSTALVPLQVNEKDTDALDAVARSLAYTYLKEDKRERKQNEKSHRVSMESDTNVSTRYKTGAAVYAAVYTYDVIAWQ